MSVREIKAKLDELGVKYDGIFEKSELLSLLAQHENRSSTSSSSSAIAMSVSDLRDVIRGLAGRTSQCTEKRDLYELAREIIGPKKCPICLDQLLASPSEQVVKLPCCIAVTHRQCLADWFLSAVQGGQYPLKCISCSSPVDDTFVEKRVLQPEQAGGKYLRYISAVENLKQLKSATKKARSTMTPEEERGLHAQGFRKCPKCGSWIEKGPSLEAFGFTVAEGCDKMTCRCGCKFCFKCGALEARCNCTGAEHGFFDHSEVLADYPRSHLEGNFGNLF